MKINRLSYREKYVRIRLGFAGLVGCGLIILATAVPVSAQWTGTLTWNATGNANWDDVNWQLNGSGGNIAFINNAPFTFSGNFDAIGSGTAAGVTLTVLDGATLYDGMVLTSTNLNWGTNNVGTLLSGSTYSFRENWNINTAGVNNAIVGSSDIVAQFTNYSGTVTVSGAQYAKTLLFNGGGNIVLASNSGTLFLAPGPDSGTVVRVQDATNVEIRADIDDRHLAADIKAGMHFRNQGGGTLTLNNNKLTATGGVNFTNNSTSVTAIHNVTIAGGGNLAFSNGTYNFTGITSVASTTNDVQLNGNSTWNIAAGAVVDLTNFSGNNIWLGNNDNSTATINIKGGVNFSKNLHIGNGNNAIGSLTLSGTGQLGADSINVGDNANNAQGRLTLTDTSWINAYNITVGANGNNGAMTLANSASATLNGNLNISTNNGVIGIFSASDNSRLTANNQIGIGNPDGSYAVVNLDGNAKLAAGYFTIANTGNGYAEINLRGNSSLELLSNSFKAIYAGKTGTAVINIYDTASINTATIGDSNDFYLGERGGAGKATLNVYSGTVQLRTGKYLYVNQNNDQNGSEGIINLSGGTIIADSIAFGSTAVTSGSNKAYLNITGGELVLGNFHPLHTGNWNSWQEADPTHTASDTQINLGGGTITLPNGLETSMKMTLTGSGGNIKFNAPGKNMWLNGVVSGTGGLQVRAGTLIISGTGGTAVIDTWTGQTVIDSGATFRVDNYSQLSISLAQLEAEGNRAAFDGAGTLNLTNGIVNIDFSNISGTEWTLFSASLLTGDDLTVGANWLAGFTNEGGGIWTRDAYTFDLSTGILTIPEPSVWTLLMTGAAILALARKRR
ncbi:MAG: hypothetical protein LBD30_09405 [Verrucomicrobiales bacterium]|jgi:hypothetical protein|nr:hypothetical protein [Verrucomicrobiales bacterium]